MIALRSVAEGKWGHAPLGAGRSWRRINTLHSDI